MLVLRGIWAVVHALVSKESSFPKRLRLRMRLLIPVHARMTVELVVATRPIGLD